MSKKSTVLEGTCLSPELFLPSKRQSYSSENPTPRHWGSRSSDREAVSVEQRWKVRRSLQVTLTMLLTVVGLLLWVQGVEQNHSPHSQGESRGRERGGAPKAPCSSPTDPPKDLLKVPPPP